MIYEHRHNFVLYDEIEIELLSAIIQDHRDQELETRMKFIPES